MTADHTGHSPRAFDVSKLVTRLREAGFRADTRQYLSAHQLILALARQGYRADRITDFRDVEKLAALLAPVFCHSPEEQARFKDIVFRWLDVTEPGPPQHRMRSTKSHREKLVAVTTRPVRVFVVMALLVMAATALFYYFVPIGFQGRIQRIEPNSRNTVPVKNAVVLFNDDPIALDSSGRFSFELNRLASPGRILVQLDGYQMVERSIDARLPAPINIDLKPIQPPEPPPAPVNGIRIGDPLVIALPEANSTIIRKTNWSKAVGLPVAAGLGLFLVLLSAHHFRRNLVLKRLPLAQRSDLTSLAVADIRTPALSGPRLRRLVGGLRRPRDEDVFELNALLTARASARAAGMFSPVWVPRKRMPEYVALIHRKSSQDHQALAFDELLDRLEQCDVAITRYFFRDDPRVCQRADDPLRQWLLSDLTVIHHACRLFIWADSDPFFDPLTGAPAPWVAKLKQWPRRVLFTPRPPYHWTRREWTLATAGMIVLPGTVNGLQVFAELPGQWRIESLFPAPYARPFPPIVGSQAMRWLDRNAPPDGIMQKLMRQLQGFLGPAGFAWLCACAIYPEINWSLTRYLAGAVFGTSRDDAGRPYSDVLPGLARLPWFRFGYMPDWLRLVLMGHLSLEQEKKFRTHLEKLLEKIARPDAKAGPTDGLKLATWVTPGDILNTSSKGDPLADTVFVGFIAGARPDRLAVQAPSVFKKMFQGLRWLPQTHIPRASRTFWQDLRAWFKGVGIRRKNGLRASLSALVALMALALSIPYYSTVRERRIDTIVHDIAFNPAGHTIASGDLDNAIGLWRLGSGEQIGIFKGHADHVARISFSSDGKILASGSWDHTARLWDVATGRPLFNLMHADAVFGVAFSPDGRTLASASGDKTVKLWDTATGLERATLTGHDGPVFSVAYSPDDRTLASGSGDRTIRLWDSRTGRPSKVLKGHTDYVSTVTFSPDGQIVASSGSEDKTIRLWDVRTGGMLRELTNSGDKPVLCAAFNPAGTSLAAGQGGKIFLWPVDLHPPPVDIEMPAVLALPLDRAKQILKKAGLKVGRIQESSQKGRTGTVVSQEPNAGMRIPPGTEVMLVVTQAGQSTPPGYCCAPVGSKSSRPVGEVFQGDDATCRQKGGIFFRDKKEAEANCAKMNAPYVQKIPSAPRSITVK